MKKKWLIDIITVLYMVLFLYAGISKLQDYTVFKNQVADSPILSPVASLIAIGLPALEILLAILFLFPKQRLKALYSSLFLMILFTTYIIAILLFYSELPCSCGGVLAFFSWSQHIVFNCFYIVLATIGIIWENRFRKKQKNTTSFSELLQS